MDFMNYKEQTMGIPCVSYKATVVRLSLLSFMLPWLPLLGVTTAELDMSSEHDYLNPHRGTCKPITTPVCMDIPYNQTFLPNTLGQTDQRDAALAIGEFTPLISVRCSEHLQKFLCMLYLPPCTIIESAIPPCRSFCGLAATQACLDILKAYGFDRPPILDCDRYPETGICIGEDSTVSQDGVTSATGSSSTDTATMSTYPNMADVNLFLLSTRGHKIQLLDVSTVNKVDAITVFSGVEAKLGADVDFYLADKYIYWASNMEGKIFRGKLILDEIRDVREIVDTVPANVESLAVDWLLGVLFWTEIYPAGLRTSSLSGRRVTTVVSENMQHPVSLALDPIEGKVFWIDRKGTLFYPVATIECYELVTNQRKLLFNITTDVIPNSGRPKALAADISEKRLYWADARSDSLHSIRYDGTDHKILLQGHVYLREPDSVAINDEHVIWIDKYTSSLVWANKEDGSGIMVIKTFESHPPQNIRLFEPKSQPKGKLNYNKTSLTEQWVELSSRENMELEEYYDDEDDDFDDFTDAWKRRKHGRPGSKEDDDDDDNAGGKSSAGRSIPSVPLSVMLLLYGTASVSGHIGL